MIRYVKYKGELNVDKYKPTYMIERVSKIPFVLLERDNIHGLIFDVDNTLTTMGKGVTEDNLKWLKEAKELGYKMCLLSNSINYKKIKKIMMQLDINGLCFAKKPSVKGFEMALNLLDLKKEEVIMVGDQIFTDIVGANNFKIKSILVKPINKKEGPGTLIKRIFEKRILKKLKEEKND